MSRPPSCERPEAATAERDAAPGPAPTSLLGKSVRGIRMLELLGRGGMGEVYVGVDERLQRRVAVKAISGERRLDPSAKARFLREARVLSQLEHPNVCRLYEYVEGEAQDLLVLEMVPGRSLRTVLEGTIAPSMRMSIARQVADALVAAHALSIVHRDLKPENVMITPEGAVKVLDFGLARPIGARPTASEITADACPGAPDPDGVLTQVGEVMGTPRYMSPEQARGEPLTAASDMYSFGLILQEIFTGRPPVDLGVAQDVMLQRARWGETGPVEGIDRNLATLIERLKSLSPFERPDAETAAARLRWIADTRRRRLRRVTVFVTAAVLLAAATVSTLGLLAAQRAQARAESSERQARAAQAEAEAVNSFLLTMLGSADPQLMGRKVMVVDVLDRAARTVEADFASHPARRAAILETLGRTYHAVGELAKAHDMLSRALALRRAESGPRAPETLASMHHLGRVLGAMDRRDEAEALLRETLSLRSSLLGAEHPDTLDTLAALAWTIHSAYRLSEAEALYRLEYEARKRTLGGSDPGTMEATRRLGMVLRDENRFEESERLLKESYEAARRLFGNGLRTLDAMESLARLYARQKRHAEAVALQRELHVRMREVRGPEHPQTLLIANHLGRSLADLGRLGEAEAVLRATIATETRVLGPAHRDTIEAMRSLAYCLDKQGRPREVRRIFRDRYQLARTHLGEEHQLTLETKSSFASCLCTQGRCSEAERLLREVLAVRRRTFGEDHIFTQSAKRLLAGVLGSLGRPAEAAALEAQLPPTGVRSGGGQ